MNHKKEPVVSVVMSVLNGLPYLAEAVASILSQTFIDFEFIVIDDGSTDETWNVLSDYALRDARLILLRNEKNSGVACSLNASIERVWLYLRFKNRGWI